MADPAWQPAAGPWGDVPQAVMKAAQACADAVIVLCLRGSDPDGLAAQLAARAAAALAGPGEQLRGLEFGEAVISAEAERRAAEILAAAGMPAPRPQRRLHAVS